MLVQKQAEASPQHAHRAQEILVGFIDPVRGGVEQVTAKNLPADAQGHYHNREREYSLHPQGQEIYPSDYPGGALFLAYYNHGPCFNSGRPQGAAPVPIGLQSALFLQVPLQ